MIYFPFSHLPHLKKWRQHEMYYSIWIWYYNTHWTRTSILLFRNEKLKMKKERERGRDLKSPSKVYSLISLLHMLSVWRFYTIMELTAKHLEKKNCLKYGVSQSKGSVAW